MAIIIPPAPLMLRDLKARLREPSQENRSGWTGTSQIVGLPGASTWSFTGTFGSITRDSDARPWRAFFVALRGRANKFRLRAVTQQQTGHANLTARTGGNAGTSIPLQGMTPSSTILLAGHAMTVTLPSGHERLVFLTADLVSNGSGQGTANFGPDLGEIPAAGAAVEIRWPHSLVRMATDTIGWDYFDRLKHGFAIDVVEAR